MRLRISQPVRAYLVALVATTCAGLANAALWPGLSGRYPLIVFFLAIGISARFGGFGPGAFCTILAGTVAAYFWIAGGARAGDAVFLSVFLVVGLLISSLYETLRRRTAQAEEAKREADRLADELRVSTDRLLKVELAARRQAEEANQVKSAFLATVSHDLRTPLSAILGWTDILKHKVVNDERRDHALQAIYRNAQQQAQLLGDLLEAAQIDSVAFRLRRQNVDVAAVVRDSCEVVEPAANAKGIHVRTDIDSDVSAMSLYADGMRLRQVVTNLLSNAVKFTPDGGEVRTRVRLIDSAVEIVVSDTGRGIAPDFLPWVFEPFRQADDAPGGAGSGGGFGLGLSIAKHLVEAHGGQIHAASDGVNRGARFTVRLPLTPTLVETHAASRAHA
jgi:signal transduction histidine kinase